MAYNDKTELEVVVTKSTAETNREVASRLSNNLSRLLREFSRDFERRIWRALQARGYPDVRPAHSAVFSNLGLGAVRVTELAERAQVTQQAMGKMLKELERLGYITRAVDSGDKRAREIKLTERGVRLAADSQQVIAQTRHYYEQKIGYQELQQLESQLRLAVGKLQLDYLPEAWVEPASAEPVPARNS